MIQHIQYFLEEIFSIKIIVYIKKKLESVLIKKNPPVIYKRYKRDKIFGSSLDKKRVFKRLYFDNVIIIGNRYMPKKR